MSAGIWLQAKANDEFSLWSRIFSPLRQSLTPLKLTRAIALVLGAYVCFLPAAHAQFAQQGPKLVGSDAAAGATEQGGAVAVSADGNTAVVGGSNDNSGAGAAWVFTRGGGPICNPCNIWSQQGAKLVGTGASIYGPAHQGQSVAVSADGNTAIMGGPNDDNETDGDAGTGAAWVFTRSGGVWTQQGAKLVGTGAVNYGGWGVAQGSSVALSADGNTAIVGGYIDNGYTGAAWVFTRSGGVWTQQGPKLVGTGAFYQGSSIALSADGNTAIVGGAGATWVFTRSGGVWAEQGGKLVGTGAVGNSEQGASVALSADGNTAVVGGPNDNSNAGAAWVFTRSGGAICSTCIVWTQQGSKLVGTGAVGSAFQGASVALSADGNTAMVGGGGDNSSAGATWVFTRSGNVWTQQGSKLVGTGAAGAAVQGGSVALSSDGNTAIVGGPDDNINHYGAVWVFVQRPVVAAIAPSGGPAAGGTSVTITGDHFAGATAVKFGSAAAASFTVTSATSIAATSPPGSGIVDVTVTTSGGTSAIGVADRFTYQPASHDFDGDGISDILWHNSNGSVSAWQMAANGTHTAFNLGVVDNAWQIAGTTSLVASTGDVDGGGKSDIVLRNTNGSLSIWEMNGGTSHTPISLGTVTTAWQIAGVGDFDGDGHADILWRHTNGSVSIWKMAANGSHTALNFGVVDNAWQVAGIGDVNHDGKADIVWRHTNGTLLIWQMNGGTSHTVLNLGAVAAAWQIVGVGDVDGDGNADLFWRHTNGSLSIWKLAPNGTHTPLNLGSVATAWQIVSIGDYNGDGRADILWRHTNGSASIWTMNANGTHTALSLGAPATDWTIVE